MSQPRTPAAKNTSRVVAVLTHRKLSIKLVLVTLNNGFNLKNDVRSQADHEESRLLKSCNVTGKDRLLLYHGNVFSVHHLVILQHLRSLIKQIFGIFKSLEDLHDDVVDEIVTLL